MNIDLPSNAPTPPALGFEQFLAWRGLLRASLVEMLRIAVSPFADACFDLDY